MNGDGARLEWNFLAGGVGVPAASPDRIVSMQELPRHTERTKKKQAKLSSQGLSP
jgi:hypothetical protein